MADARAALQARIAALIARLADGSRDDDARDTLLEEVRAYQAENVPAYGRFLAQTSVPNAALPTDVFRHVRVCGHTEEQDLRVFRTSGTTQGLRGQCCLRDLRLYDLAAEAAARYALFPDRTRVRLIILAPTENELPDSSLSYMLQRFVDWFGADNSEHVFVDRRLDVERLRRALTEAVASDQPVALLGTSFAFVHAEEALGAQRFLLPTGSRMMQTGGFKGRSREYSPTQLASMLSERYGIPHSHATQEYGMTELCSQMYGASLRQVLLDGSAAATAALWVPGWVRVQPVDPRTLDPVAHGEVGMLRIDDLANLDTVSAIQTADLARVTDEGLWLLGRSSQAVPRGCSLAIDEFLESE